MPKGRRQRGISIRIIFGGTGKKRPSRDVGEGRKPGVGQQKKGLLWKGGHSIRRQTANIKKGTVGVGSELTDDGGGEVKGYPGKNEGLKQKAGRWCKSQ